MLQGSTTASLHIKDSHMYDIIHLDLSSSLCGVYHQKRLSTWVQRGVHSGIVLMNCLFNFLFLERVIFPTEDRDG